MHGLHDQPALHSRAVRILDALGLADAAGSLPGHLSAHARRRLALARALVADTPLVVIDEIETALDSVYGDRIVTELRAVQARTGATVLVTTHDFGLARALGDTLAVLSNGRIVASGPAAELLHQVETGADFEHRFGRGDFMGPPQLGDALRHLDQSQDRTFEIDARTVWVAVAGLLLTAVLIAYLLIGPPPFR